MTTTTTEATPEATMIYFTTPTACTAAPTADLVSTTGGNPITLDNHGDYALNPRPDARPLTLADYASTLDDIAACRAAADRATDPVTIDYFTDELADLYGEAALIRRAMGALAA